MYYIIFAIVIVLLLFLIWEVSNYNRFQIARIRISEAENNIDILLQKKFSLLERTIKIIEETSENYKKDQILSNLIKIKNKKLNNFELNEELEQAYIEYKGILDLDANLGEVESLCNINYDLVDVDNDLNAAKKYYNDTIVSYNKLVHCFPSNIVGFFFHYKCKDFYSSVKGEDLRILKINKREKSS